MNDFDYQTTEKRKQSYVVYGLDNKGKKVFVTNNGYNPYEWKYEGYYISGAVHFKHLEDAKFEADHAPKNLVHITIEKITTHQIIQTKVEMEKIEYKPKGLEELIPF